MRYKPSQRAGFLGILLVAMGVALEAVYFRAGIGALGIAMIVAGVLLLGLGVLRKRNEEK